MRINPNVCQPHFGRAFTTEEKNKLNYEIRKPKKKIIRLTMKDIIRKTILIFLTPNHAYSIIE